MDSTFYGSIDADWELDSQDGEIEDDEHVTGYSADHILVLLDCGNAMWKAVLPDPEFEEDLLSPFDFTVKHLTDFLKYDIRLRSSWKSGRRNGFGLYLYNTRQREHVEWDLPVKRGKTAPSAKNKTADTAPDGDDHFEDDEEGEDPAFGARPSTVHEIIPLEPAGIQSVQTLKAIQEDVMGDRQFDVQEAYAPTSENHDAEHTALQAAFMSAAQIVQDAKCVHSKPKEDRLPDRVRVWVISNEDTLGEFTVTAAKDLVDNKVEISLFPLPRADKEAFDYERSYASLPSIVCEAEGFTKKELLTWWASDPFDGQSSVYKAVRPIHTLPMLWPGEQDTNEETAYLQLNWFRLVQTALRPSKICIHQETGVQLNGMIQYVDKDSISQEILYEKVSGDLTPPKISPRLCSYLDVQGTRVPLSFDDKIELKAKSHPHKFASLRVIGFRPADSIDRTTSNLEPAYFCMPPDDTEARVKGSCVAFSALHTAMNTKNALMIGEVLTRKTAASRLVAAWAVPELFETDEDGEDVLVRPSGLLVILLPFESEAKRPVVDAATRATEPLATDALVDEAKAIMNGITISPTFGENFPNVSLNLFWDKLEEIALNERNAVQSDETLMTRDDVVSRVGSHLDNFMQLLPEDPAPVKKRKELVHVPDDSGIDWEDAYSRGQLGSFKIDQLKKYLQSVGEKVTGRKQELIDRMIPFLEKAVNVKKEA